MAITQPIRDKNLLIKMANYFLDNEQIRNLAIFVINLYTALRVSDILSLRWDDVFDFATNKVRISLTTTEKKTGKQKIIALNADIILVLTLFADESAKQGGFLFESPRKPGQALCRQQFNRILAKAAEAVGIEGRVSSHAFRKTFGYFAWKANTPQELILDIYNHSSWKVTRRYLGITQDDINAVYLGMELLA